MCHDATAMVVAIVPLLNVESAEMALITRYTCYELPAMFKYTTVLSANFVSCSTDRHVSECLSECSTDSTQSLELEVEQLQQSSTISLSLSLALAVSSSTISDID